ncbi:MAG: NAD(P)/FAD-dependent oxidoreductase [Terriglobales bacterium]
MAPHAAYDVVVVGAGIVGAACAWACARRGLRVLVLEGAGVGSGATAAGMGHIVVMDDSEAQFALTRYSQELWQGLATDHAHPLPPEVEYTPSGTIWVAADGEEMAEVERKHACYGDRGVPTEVLGAAALARLEPNLRPGLAGGLRVPGDAVVYPPCAAAFFLEQARALGAEVLLGAQAAAIGGGSARLAGGREFAARVIVNAAGAQAGALTPGLPIRGRKGHLVITDRYPGWVRHQLVELGYLKSAHSHGAESVAFNVQPRATGQILIGSSRQWRQSGDDLIASGRGVPGIEARPSSDQRERPGQKVASHFGDADGAVDHAILARMVERAREYMPGLARLLALRAWTGFRAATPDSLPLIGFWPDDPSVFLATGHEGLGITTSLGTAELAAGQIAGATPAIRAACYHPHRDALAR